MSDAPERNPAQPPVAAVESAEHHAVGNSAVSGPVYVVGIGASAGGLEALEALFDALPADTGMAYVVVQHLSPDFKSLMDELIRRHTEMAVFRVENGMEVKPNAIYLIPAGKEMIISQGRLLLTDKDPAETLTLPIDHFFRSLAQDCGKKAIGVVLSGSGSDGSRGVREIHNMGGVVIAQDSATAAFDSMPNAAEETGVVDITAPPDEIADALLRLVNHPLQRAAHAADQPTVPEDGIKRILRVIRDAYGIDFSYYKPTTVMRRIERRLLLNRATDLDAYVETVSTDSDEMNQLYRDLLIGVTEFFRDPAAFKMIEESVLPELVLKVPIGQEIRMWVAGCATGEEAYSLAMLVHERLATMNRPITVRIFATDVHRASLDHASAGVYSEEVVRQISPTRLERYFTRTRDGYRVTQDLRNMVVFAPHNLIKDAPFTRLDLITCRNLLIYLQPLAQKKVLSLFHFALKTGGVLLLGPSETAGELADEFDVINANWRVYRKRRDIRLSPDLRLHASPPSSGASPPPKLGGFGRTAFPIRTLEKPISAAERELVGLYDALLSQHMPPALVINEAQQLVHSFGDVNELLRIPSGRAFSNALDLLPTDLRTVVVGAMQQVSKKGQAVSYHRVTIETANGKRQVRVTVEPISHRLSNAAYMLIVLEQADKPSAAPTHEGHDVTLDDVSRERIDVLETELRHSRESLQATIEELESSNEELQATNEELVASNEELQSTNEELHSVNEELYTVNAEYQKKISELTELTHDMDNFLNSTDVHTLFLDGDLCIRKFTPQMAAEFNLIPGDIGRRINGFTHNIPCDNLLEKLADVISTGKRIEEEFQTPEHANYLLRILPYRGETHRSGVVLTLVDVTESRQAETRFRGTFENAAVGIAHIELDGRFARVNERLCEILGSQRDDLLQRTLDSITFAEDRAEGAANFAALRRGGVDRINLEQRLLRSDAAPVWVSLTVSMERDGQGAPLYAIGIVQDISASKQLEAKLSDAVVQRDRFLAMLSHELRNPLSAIINAASLLDRLGDGKDGAEAPRQVIHRQTDRVAALLSDLLDVTRVTQGKIALKKRVCNLNDLISESVETVKGMAAAHCHEIEVRLDKSPLWINADSARVQQMIENLLTNAIKYTPDKGHITIAAAVEGVKPGDPGWAALRVIDNGCGMSPELLATAFEMFVQSDTTLDRSEGGMGVGLTLVKSLAEMHGGSVAGRSDGVGRGSEFTLRLPLVPAPNLPPQTAKGVPADAAPAPLRLLIVEDNDDARDMLRALLELDGYHVTTAVDGQDGLDRLQQDPFDVALIDIGLPTLTGYEVVRRFRSQPNPPSVRLIALTGYGRDADIHTAIEAGFDEHLVKPVDISDLNRVLLAPLDVQRME